MSIGVSSRISINFNSIKVLKSVGLTGVNIVRLALISRSAQRIRIAVSKSSPASGESRWVAIVPSLSCSASRTGIPTVDPSFIDPSSPVASTPIDELVCEGSAVSEASQRLLIAAAISSSLSLVLTSPPSVLISAEGLIAGNKSIAVCALGLHALGCERSGAFVTVVVGAATVPRGFKRTGPHRLA